MMRKKAVLIGVLMVLTFGQGAQADTSEPPEFEQACVDIKQHNCKCAKDRLVPLAKGGHAKSQVLLGILYEEGVGVEKDIDQAITWYEKAASRGLREAESRLGHLYLNEKNVLQHDEVKAQKWLSRAAQKGEVEAQTHLAGLILKSPDLHKRRNEAVRWLHLAADRGSDEAKRQLESLPGGVELEQTVGKGKDKLKEGARSYSQGLGNIENSWEGYGDIVQSVRQVGTTAAGN